MPGQRRFAFVINSLTGGGAERVVSTLLTHFSKAGSPLGDAELHLVLLDREEERYTVPPAVQRHVLDARGGFLASVRRLTAKLAELRPQVAISFLARANCANVVAAGILGHRCVISERTNTTAHLGRGPMGRINRTLIQALYRRADCVIAVSEGVRDGLVSRYGVPPDKIAVIHNPFDLDAIRLQAAMPPPEVRPPAVISVARLTPGKRHDVLIRAFAESGMTGDLMILGEGEERQRLLGLAADLGMAERVHLPGHLGNPFPLVARAGVYASASSYEGFPNAIAEAMVLGRAVVSTACPFGPAELLQGEPPAPGAVTEGRCGLLVPVGDVGAMADALRRLADVGVAARLGTCAARRMESLDVATIGARYAEIIVGSGTQDPARDDSPPLRSDGRAAQVARP